MWATRRVESLNPSLKDFWAAEHINDTAQELQGKSGLEQRMRLAAAGHYSAFVR
jgi:hypothetical protein